ncbi:MAG: ribonuclease J, partial [Erysipelotrichaceae bacterium]|nr:ribonuclease J [Erysipelotrichaceae bacterium]
FVFVKEGQTLMKEAEMVVYEALRKVMVQKTTFGELKNTIKKTLEPYFYTRTHRTPIIIPVILNHKDAIALMQANRAKY